ncbi:hypothetical protein BBJ29_000658 [Phytophthora kernoviae]|uniref:Tudor-knot domain-containing protein n=1 Tax=Phytophthora kernoviae TaxID=325452 RepID=A0A3F2RXU5_9STRA|nr:hypothetical protein BBJ29_000658 [Phytophthora kernoviae]RLN66355.1 hypothetical protein BBP00_00002251 [Phytophthora kernoviae]
MAKSGQTSSSQCVGYLVDARDKKKLWTEAKIIQINPKTHKVKVHFVGWSKIYDLWVDPKTMAPHGRHSSPTEKGTNAKSWDGNLKLFDEVLDTSKTLAVKATPKASPKAKIPAKKPKAAKQTPRPTKQKESTKKNDDQPVEEPSSEDEVAPAISKKRKVNDGKATKDSLIRTQNASATDQFAEWSDISATLAKAKETDREDNKRAHTETLQLEKERFLQTMSLEERQLQLKEKKLLLEERRIMSLEERRVVSFEQEARCRMQLLQAQAQKETVQAQREQVLLKLDVATSRKRLRDGGVPEMEIDELFPIYPS